MHETNVTYSVSNNIHTSQKQTDSFKKTSLHMWKRHTLHKVPDGYTATLKTSRKVN